MRGRKPKPTKLKLIKGNPGKRKLNKNEPQPENTAPEMPSFLQGEERNAWQYLVRELTRMGIIESCSRANMVVYCHFWTVAVEAKTKLEELRKAGDGTDPKVIKTKQGNFIPNPWLGIANHAAKELVKVSAALGLDIRERGRMSLPDNNHNNNPWEALK
jgi:P27 family predicted phage terminase small subunit